jgi:RNA polymerase sigma-70 factor (ECF subfamily)
VLDQLLRGCREQVARTLACRSAGRSGRAEVEDLIQETLLEILIGLKRFVPRSEHEFRGWLRAVARNNLRDHGRRGAAAKRGKVRAFSDLAAENLESLVAPLPEPEAEVGAAELRERLHRALQALPQRDREVLVLRKARGLTHHEIALRLELAGASSARSVYLRALRKLHARLEHPAIKRSSTRRRTPRRKA